MKIQLRTDQKTAIEAGVETWGNIEVDVPLSDLSAEERKVIAERGGNLKIVPTKHSGYVSVCVSPTSPAMCQVKEALAGIEAIRQADMEKGADKARSYVAGASNYYNFPDIDELPAELRDRVETRRAALALIEQEKKDAETSAQKAEAEKKAAGIEAMRQWGLKNGTPLLIARIEEDLGWDSLAEEEFFRVNMPEGFSMALYDSVTMIKSRTQPTLAEIRLLREWREKVTEIITAPSLGWSIVEHKHDADCGDNEGYCDAPKVERKFPSLDLTLVAPNGATQVVLMDLGDLE